MCAERNLNPATNLKEWLQSGVHQKCIMLPFGIGMWITTDPNLDQTLHCISQRIPEQSNNFNLTKLWLLEFQFVPVKYGRLPCFQGVFLIINYLSKSVKCEGAGLGSDIKKLSYPYSQQGCNIQYKQKGYIRGRGGNEKGSMQGNSTYIGQSKVSFS